jgi:hypothetical protein
MGPLVFAAPEGAFTQLHQDGHGTVGTLSRVLVSCNASGH